MTTELDRLVQVFVDEPNCINKLEKPKVTINWSAIGSVSIGEAEVFRDLLTKKIEEAEKIESSEK